MPIFCETTYSRALTDTTYLMYTKLPPKVEGVCDACGGKLEARADDKPEVVRDRLKVYHKETAPLKDFYAARNLLKTVENQPTVAETTTAILKALGL